MQKELPRRKGLRLQGYDYSKTGCYFVTLCVKDGHALFGKIAETTALRRPYVDLTPLGICVNETIQKASKDGVMIDKYVIMPNHIHMIVALHPEVSNRGQAGDRGRSPLHHVVRNIKSYVTKWAGFSMWQRSFHDHIIRDKDEYRMIRQYIGDNPARWFEDKYFR